MKVWACESMTVCCIYVCMFVRIRVCEWEDVRVNNGVRVWKDSRECVQARESRCRFHRHRPSSSSQCKSVQEQDDQTCAGCGRWVNMAPSFKSFLFLGSRSPAPPALRGKTLFQTAPVVMRPGFSGPRSTCHTLTLFISFLSRSVGPRVQVFVSETLGSPTLSAVPSP